MTWAGDGLFANLGDVIGIKGYGDLHVLDFSSGTVVHMSAGLAVFTTSVTIAIGFSILCLSNFIPTVIFGIFTSMAMIFAMIGVLILLPSLIMLFKK